MADEPLWPWRQRPRRTLPRLPEERYRKHAMIIGLNLFYLLPSVNGGTETYARGLIEGLHRLGKRSSVSRVSQPRGERLAAAGRGKHSSDSLSSGGHQPLGKVCLRAGHTAAKAATGPCRHCAFVGLCGAPFHVLSFGGDHTRPELSGLSYERGTARQVGVLCPAAGSSFGSMLQRMEALSLSAG